MKKLTDLKNPITSKEANLFSVSDWLGSVLYVAWLGMVMVLGIKVLMKADTLLPGNNTPAAYKTAVTETTGSGITVL